jgi:hypothetical protein
MPGRKRKPHPALEASALTERVEEATALVKKQRRKPKVRVSKKTAMTLGSPLQARLVAALAATGGDQKLAAEMVGMRDDYVRRLTTTNTAIRACLDEIRQLRLAEMAPWDAHAALAQDELFRILLSSGNDFARLKAAELILAYHLGKPVQRTEVEEVKGRKPLRDETFRYVLARMAATGESMASALAHAEKHPQEVAGEVRRWLEVEIQDAEVIE